jgi:hypothetical protein
MNINQQLVSVTRRIASEGIGKSRKNEQQGYKFRGVDEVMNAFAPILATEGIYLRPRFTERDVAERTNKNGTALFYVTVRGEFDFSNEAGEVVTVGPFYGEAMDSGDKATNKAMATAFKYAMFQTFCVPLEAVTGGDADLQTHEIAARPSAEELRRIKCDELVEAYQESVDAIRNALDRDDLYTAAEAWYELDQDVMRGLWVAPTKGGPFTTKHREIMKSNEFTKFRPQQEAAA